MKPMRTGDNALEELASWAVQCWVKEGLCTRQQAAAFEAPLHSLTDAATHRGLRTLSEVTIEARRDPSLFSQPSDLADAGDGTEAQPGSHRHHCRRNLLLALCWTTALREGRDGPRRDEVPQLPRRTNLTQGRPLYDDERLLVRLITTRKVLAGTRHHIGAACGLLTDIGCMPGEATDVHLIDLDNINHPKRVQAPGDRKREHRKLRTDRWQRRMLGIVASGHQERGLANQPLAYSGHGHDPGSPQAQMSCAESLNNILHRAGLWKDTEVTAVSISVSAADLAQREKGDRAAVRMLGRNKRLNGLEEAARDLKRIGTTPVTHEKTKVTSFTDEPFPPYKPSGS
jgi:hypothetical protein